MHCKACDNLLTDREATRRFIAIPEEFVDLCNKCLENTGILYTENPTAPDNKDIEEALDFFDEVKGG